MKKILGIELGSTRIKSVLIDENGKVLATGSFGWENKLVNGHWSYSMDDVRIGLHINAARYVCIWEPTFAVYLEKKRSEGKHYYVALSHAAKKLVRLLYHLETTGEKYKPVSV